MIPLPLPNRWRTEDPEQDGMVRLLPLAAQRPVMGRVARPTAATPPFLPEGNTSPTVFTRPITGSYGPPVMGQLPLARSPHETIDNLANAETMAEHPNDPAYLANLADINAGRELAKLKYADAHPWGSPENHPGVIGKIGHVAGEAGNILGDLFVPGAMEEIPGTQLNRQAREQQLEKQLETGRKDETAMLRAEHGLVPKLTPAESTFKTLTSEGTPPLTALGELSAAQHPQTPRAGTTPAAGYTANQFGNDLRDAFPNLKPGYVAGTLSRLGHSPTQAQVDRAWDSAQRESDRIEARTASATGRRQSESATSARETRSQGATAAREHEHEIFSAKQGAENEKQREYAALERQIAQGVFGNPPNQAKIDALKQDIEDRYATRLSGIEGRTIEPYEYAAPNGMVAVQIPGQPVGHIPRSALARFKREHPDAKVLTQ